VKQVAYFFWTVPDERRPGKTRRSAVKLSAEDAALQYPGQAISPIESTLEMRELPETDEEAQAVRLRMLPRRGGESR
jgi:hypothetical protein